MFLKDIIQLMYSPTATPFLPTAGRLVGRQDPMQAVFGAWNPNLGFPSAAATPLVPQRQIFNKKTKKKKSKKKKKIMVNKNKNVVLDGLELLLNNQLKEICVRVNKGRNAKQSDEDEEEPEEEEEGTLRLEDFTLRKREGKAVTEKLLKLTFEIPMNHRIYEEMEKLAPRTQAAVAKQKKKLWLPFSERLQGWVVERRRRQTTRMISCDTYYHHMPSQVQFKSKVEVTKFVVNNIYPLYVRSSIRSKKIKAIKLPSSSSSTPPKKRGRKSNKSKNDTIESSMSSSSSSTAKSVGSKRKYVETQLDETITQEEIDIAKIVVSLNKGMSLAPTNPSGVAYDNKNKVQVVEVIDDLMAENDKEESIVIDLSEVEEKDKDETISSAPPMEMEDEPEVLGGGVLDSAKSLVGSTSEPASFIDALKEMGWCASEVFELGDSNSSIAPVEAINVPLGEGITAWGDYNNDSYNDEYCYRDYDHYHNYIAPMVEEARVIEQSLATLTAATTGSKMEANHDQGGGTVNFDGTALATVGGSLGGNPNPSLGSGLLDDVVRQGFEIGSSANDGCGFQSKHESLTLEEIFETFGRSFNFYGNF